PIDASLRSGKLVIHAGDELEIVAVTTGGGLAHVPVLQDHAQLDVLGDVRRDANLRGEEVLAEIADVRLVVHGLPDPGAVTELVGELLAEADRGVAAGVVADLLPDIPGTCLDAEI